MPEWKMIFCGIPDKTDGHRVNSAFAKLAILIDWSYVDPDIVIFMSPQSRCIEPLRIWCSYVCRVTVF